MPKLILITLLNSLMIMTGGGSAYAQKPPQNVQQDEVVERTAPQREVPKQIVNVALKNDLLSVDLVNASLGETLRSIAQKAGFSIEGNSRAFSQKMTTKFNDLEVDIGIIRLFSLVKESNYLINYDTKGSISKLKVYDSGAVGSTTLGSPPTTGTGAFPFKTWRSRRLRNSQQPAIPSPPPPPAPQSTQPETPLSQPETPLSQPETSVAQPETPDLEEKNPSEGD
jgi:hypothetical protein